MTHIILVRVHIMYGDWGGATGLQKTLEEAIRLHDAKSTLQASNPVIINVTTGLSLAHQDFLGSAEDGSACTSDNLWVNCYIAYVCSRPTFCIYMYVVVHLYPYI